VPIYEYRCRNGHSFEVIQRMVDDPIDVCEQCGAPVERVFHPIAVHFKGSGFYTTDYGSKSKAAAAASSDGAESKADKGDSKESKSESSGTKTESKAKASSGTAE
jgi:putative FmdB family regulatory protein